jgi:hypothetical protein
MNYNTIPDNPQNINIKLFLLDPLTVIIKLAILGNKPIGTKIGIQNNILFFQEPGPFQSLCRYVFNTNKTDLQYLYNPIEIACSIYLTAEYVKKNARIQNLFKCAQTGLNVLKETYKASPIIRMCLCFFSVIISNHLHQPHNPDIFTKDGMSVLYTKEFIDNVNSVWSPEKINIVLDLIRFLDNDTVAANVNVKSLETIVENNDKEMMSIFTKI